MIATCGLKPVTRNCSAQRRPCFICFSSYQRIRVPSSSPSSLPSSLLPSLLPSFPLFLLLSLPPPSPSLLVADSDCSIAVIYINFYFNEKLWRVLSMRAAKLGTENTRCFSANATKREGFACPLLQQWEVHSNRNAQDRSCSGPAWRGENVPTWWHAGSPGNAAFLLSCSHKFHPWRFDHLTPDSTFKN